MIDCPLKIKLPLHLFQIKILFIKIHLILFFKYIFLLLGVPAILNERQGVMA